MDSPTKEQIRAARKAVNLTQAQAGALVYHARRSWQDWELDKRAMDPAVFELFQIKTGQVRAVVIAPSPASPPAPGASSPADPEPSPGSPLA
jgi:hypothetical protein